MADDLWLLRPVTMADAQMLLDWRNDASTRRNSRNNEPIDFVRHEAWLARTLGSSEHIVRIAEAGSRPVAVLRADRIEEGWELSWTVAPGARGRGFGGRMLKNFVASLDGRLVAVIRKNNLASAKIAAAAGLMCVGEAKDTDYELWARMTKVVVSE